MNPQLILFFFYPPDVASPLPVSPFTQLILRQYGWGANFEVASETLGSSTFNSDAASNKIRKRADVI